MGERDLTVEDVEREHLAQVDPRAHAVYVVAILVGGFALMLLLIVWMASSAS